MSWFGAAAMLRDRARRLTAIANEVPANKRLATLEAMRIFSDGAVHSLRQEWIAAELEALADAMEHRGRDAHTPVPVIKPP